MSWLCGSLTAVMITDLIFKNQAMGNKEKGGDFVNDLLRTEFHKYVSSVLCHRPPNSHLVPGNSWASLSRFVPLSSRINSSILMKFLQQ